MKMLKRTLAVVLAMAILSIYGLAGLVSFANETAGQGPEGGTLLAEDTFTAEDGTLLSAYTGGTGFSGGWINDAGETLDEKYKIEDNAFKFIKESNGYESPQIKRMLGSASQINLGQNHAYLIAFEWQQNERSGEANKAILNLGSNISIISSPRAAFELNVGGISESTGDIEGNMNSKYKMLLKVETRALGDDVFSLKVFENGDGFTYTPDEWDAVVNGGQLGSTIDYISLASGLNRAAAFTLFDEFEQWLLSEVPEDIAPEFPEVPEALAGNDYIFYDSFTAPDGTNVFTDYAGGLGFEDGWYRNIPEHDNGDTNPGYQIKGDEFRYQKQFGGGVYEPIGLARNLAPESYIDYTQDNCYTIVFTWHRFENYSDHQGTVYFGDELGIRSGGGQNFTLFFNGTQLVTDVSSNYEIPVKVVFKIVTKADDYDELFVKIFPRGEGFTYAPDSWDARMTSKINSVSKLVKVDAALQSDPGSRWLTFDDLEGFRGPIVPMNDFALDQQRLEIAAPTTELPAPQGKITATFSPSNASSTYLEWESSDKNVATVDKDGLVTGHKKGIATISATSSSGLKKQCVVLVGKLDEDRIPVTGITIEDYDKEIYLSAGSTAQLTPTIMPVDATEKYVYYTVSEGDDSSVANVSTTGLITALKAGDVTYTVTTVDGSFSDTFQVHVRDGIDIKDTPANMAKGSTSNVVLKVPVNGVLTEVDNKAATYVSSNPSVITISNGTLTAVDRGIATITATYTLNGNTVTDSMDITVSGYSTVYEDQVVNKTYEGTVNNGIATILFTDTKTSKDGAEITVKGSGENTYALKIKDNVYQLSVNGADVPIEQGRYGGSNQFTVDMSTTGKARILLNGQVVYDQASTNTGITSITPSGAAGTVSYKELRICSVTGAAPSVMDVNIVRSGSSINATYTFVDLDRDKEGASELVWFASNGTGTASRQIASGTKSISASLAPNQYVQLRVTPVDQTGAVGEPVYSNSLYVSSGSGQQITSPGTGGGGYTPPSTTPPPTHEPETKTFEDINGHWAQEQITDMANRGYVNGKSDTQFAPDDVITRAEFAAIVTRALKLETSPYKGTFSDVSENDWFFAPVEAAEAAGILSGSDGTFRPNDNITREEMTKVIVEAYKNATGKTIEGAEAAGFADMDTVSAWAVDYVNQAVHMEFILGKSDNRFEPKANASRAEATVIISRLINAMEGK